MNGAAVTAYIANTNDNLRSTFEMFGGPGANKHGTVAFDTGTSGAPAVTSSSTATATVGSAFSYQIAASNSPTAYANTGGNAPVGINPTTGLVTGTFTAPGTFTFSFTAANASGTSAITTVTVTVTAGVAVIPTITSSTSASGTVGKIFTYSGTANGSPTSWAIANAPSWLTLNTATGILSGTPGAAGTFTFALTARNAAGTSTAANITLTIAAAAAGSSGYAGAYGGTIFFSNNGSAETNFSTYTMTVAANGAVSLVVGAGVTTGTVNASGTITFATPNTFGLVTGDIANQRFNATGLLVNGFKYRFVGTGYTGTTGVAVAIAAPANFVGYRGKIGASYQFNVTGTNVGAVWGTDVYTDDSSVAAAAVHAGVLAIGETKTVTVTILAGQNSYAASTRNGISASTWGSWGGSYSFAGAGDATSVAVATALPTAAPGFVASTGSFAVGGRLVVPVTVTGGGTYTYRWYLNGVLIAGAFSNPYIVESLTAANAGTYSVDVTNSFGTTRVTAGTVTVNSVGAPTFNLQPFDKVVTPGGTFTLATNADGSGLSYQWLRNGVALAGETGAILLRNNANAGDAGSYTVRVNNSGGTITSNPAVVTLNANASIISNLSVRTNAGASQIVILGITVSGTGKKRVIIRAVGPGLDQFLSGAMTDPKLAVYDGQTKILENNNWDSSPATANAFTSVGAFPLTNGSKDAALVAELDAGRGYSIQVSSNTAQAGIVLMEIYDADTAPTSKLGNASVRSISAPGADVLIMGFTLRGSGQRTLLVRGSGPALIPYNVPNTLADPKLTLFNSAGRELLTNNDWANADFVAEMVQAQNFSGAFPFATGSKDSSTLALLDSGGYSVQVSGNDNGTGEALAEIYEIP